MPIPSAQDLSNLRAAGFSGTQHGNHNSYDSVRHSVEGIFGTKGLSDGPITLSENFSGTGNIHSRPIEQSSYGALTWWNNWYNQLVGGFLTPLANNTTNLAITDIVSPLPLPLTIKIKVKTLPFPSDPYDCGKLTVVVEYENGDYTEVIGGRTRSQLFYDSPHTGYDEAWEYYPDRYPYDVESYHDWALEFGTNRITVRIDGGEPFVYPLPDQRQGIAYIGFKTISTAIDRIEFVEQEEVLVNAFPAPQAWKWPSTSFGLASSVMSGGSYISISDPGSVQFGTPSYRTVPFAPSITPLTTFGSPTVQITASGIPPGVIGLPIALNINRVGYTLPSTRFSWAYTAVNQTGVATGFTSQRFGTHQYVVLFGTVSNKVCSAAGWLAATISPVTSLGAVACLETGAPPLSAFGTPSAAKIVVAQGVSPGSFGQPRSAISLNAAGVQGVQLGTPTHQRGLSALSTHRATRWGTAFSARSNTFKVYPRYSTTRFAQPKGTQRFNYQAQGFVPTLCGEHAGEQTHHAMHMVPSVRLGSHLLKRNVLC